VAREVVSQSYGHSPNAISRISHHAHCAASLVFNPVDRKELRKERAGSGMKE
jgi:hypothetical protein